MRLAVFEGFVPGVPFLGDESYGGVVDDLLAAQVQSIRIQTAYGPDIFIPKPFEPAPPPPPGTKSAADYLKPRIEIQLGGGSPITWSPYGDPRPSKWPVIKLGLIVAGVLTTFGVVKATRTLRRR